MIILSFLFLLVSYLEFLRISYKINYQLCFMNIFINLVIGLCVVFSLLINGNLGSSNIASAVILNDNLTPSNIVYEEGLSLESLFRDNYDLNSETNPVMDDLNSNPEVEKESDKYVVLMFDRGYQNIFTTAKPILDKYGFKASIFIACDYIENGKGMNWNQVRQLYLDGYDIQSHGSEHKRLTDVQSYDEIESIVSGGKECLEEQGFSPSVFQAPYNKGGNDPIIIDTISKYFDLAFTGHSELMFLNCDGWENFGYDKENYYGTTDCSPYFTDGTPTPTNKFGIKEWSHDREHSRINDKLKGEPHGLEVSQALFDKFVQVVNDQSYFNINGEINAIPIIGYHEIEIDDSVSTSPELFELEMEYLYENGFQVITIEDLGYDEYQERFHIKNVSA